jgi:hypothetical protein
MSPEQKDQLFDNVKAAMEGVPTDIIKRRLARLYWTDPEYRIGDPYGNGCLRSSACMAAGEDAMQNPASIRDILIPANDEALNAATKHQIDPDRIVTTILHQRHALPIGDYEAKYRAIYRT